MFDDVFAHLLQRPADSYKYSFGHALIIGGSPGMVGAPLLAAHAALRTGAGLVTIASKSLVIDMLEGRIPELMTTRLSGESTEAIATLNAFIAERKVTVVLLGPGMPADEYTQLLFEHLMKTCTMPLIVDGGGLGVLASCLDILANAPGPRILTPHRGEFVRLYGELVPEQPDQLRTIARDFARRHHVTLVLKGNLTYVARADGVIYENTTGTPALATAGTGDVLGGIIAGLVAQNVELGRAAEAATYIHGLAGQIAEASKTQPGVIATDVIEAIPIVYHQHLSK